MLKNILRISAVIVIALVFGAIGMIVGAYLAGIMPSNSSSTVFKVTKPQAR